jgi:hypothetical protein
MGEGREGPEQDMICGPNARPVVIAAEVFRNFLREYALYFSIMILV